MLKGQRESGLGDMGLNQLWLTKTKIVDIVIKRGNIVSVQVEVAFSKSSHATTLELHSEYDDAGYRTHELYLYVKNCVQSYLHFA